VAQAAGRTPVRALTGSLGWGASGARSRASNRLSEGRQHRVELCSAVSAVHAHWTLVLPRATGPLQRRTRCPWRASTAAAADSAVSRSLTSRSGVPFGTVTSNSTRKSMTYSLVRYVQTCPRADAGLTIASGASCRAGGTPTVARAAMSMPRDSASRAMWAAGGTLAGASKQRRVIAMPTNPPSRHERA